MEPIKISIDSVAYKSKPKNVEAAGISNRIADNKINIESNESLKQVIYEIGEGGYSFSPATFNGKRKKDNFEQMQLMVLDFDGSISFDDVKKRADEYDIPILAAYDTLSSVDSDRFRVLFLNDISINDKNVANTYKKSLMEIFPETDKTDCDIAKMYYGGKKVIYYDEKMPTISIASTIMSLSYYMEQKYGPTHYKKKIKEFAINNNIRLNSKGFIQNPLTEDEGASESGKKSPNPSPYIKGIGEKLPNNSNNVLFRGDTSSSVDGKGRKIHSLYRSEALSQIKNHCMLYREFETGKQKLNHDELFGIATNIIQIEGGINEFKQTISKHGYYSDKIDKWNYNLKYMKNQGYKAEHCSKFCPYSDKCIHTDTILTTAKPKIHTMQKLSNYREEYYSIEDVQKDLKHKLEKAVSANDDRWHIIKAQTAIGKTEAYLDLMKSTDGCYLIVVPTNKLKHDVEKRARKKGIKIFATPSLDEYEDYIPEKVWKKIVRLRSTGQHTQVHALVEKIALEEHDENLMEYLKEKMRFEQYNGNTVTTHRMLLNMDRRTLDKYDEIIIDEDIILCSIVSNQCEISISVMEKLMDKLKEIIKSGNADTKYSRLAKKIKNIIKGKHNKTFIELESFKWECSDDDNEIILNLADIPSLCHADRIMYRKVEDDSKLAEDSIVFLKPYEFKERKYIMVSATVDKDVCEYCLGKQNVKFYECKIAGYKGRLNQYYEKSMSRACIDKDINILNRISERSGFKNMITFKKYNRGDMYFGNAIGCDYLKGQDIDVVGTPYQVDFLYKLIAFTFDIKFDEDCQMMPNIECQYNGYKFRFTTYDNEELRNIQFWMIESELEQAVGRARLLRCDCTVNLYSNFPIRQAVMCKMEDNDDVFVKKRKNIDVI